MIKKPGKPFPLSKYILVALRRIWNWHPARKEALRLAQVSENMFKCSLCGALCYKWGVAIDHKDPVVSPATGFVDWNTYIARLFCAVDNLQAICKLCHKKKTAAERKLRTRKKAA